MSCPAISFGASDPSDSGRSSNFTYPLFQLPMGGDKPHSGTAREKKEVGAIDDEQKAKEVRDKKVDDAIKKAWEEK
jgi:hypothetical protein